MNRISQIPRSNYPAFLAAVALLVILAVTPAYASNLIRIEPNGLHGADTTPYRELKVCLIVKDARPEGAVNAQMVGRMGGYVLTLMNPENLETIFAHSIADSLEFSGYEVVRVYPERPAQLSNTMKKKATATKAELKLAKKAQLKTDKAQAHTLREIGGFGDAVSIRERPGTLTSQGGTGWTNGADVVLEVALDKFSSAGISHFATVEILAWSVATLTIGPGESGSSGNLATTEASGWGELEGGGASRATWKRALDMAFRMTINRMESVFLSEEFFDALKAASGSPKQTD